MERLFYLVRLSVVRCPLQRTTDYGQRTGGEQMSYVLGLKCKECGHRVPVSAVHVCEQCFGPYEVEYDYAQMKGKVTRESIARGPKSLWRYKDFLPIAGHPQAGLYSGFTPLKGANRLAAGVGCTKFWIKDDRCNYPTYSYKESVGPVGITKALQV